MKKLIVILIMFMPLFTFSQATYDVLIDNQTSTADVRATLYETTTTPCSAPFAPTSTNVNTVYAGNSWSPSSGSLHVYQIQVCLHFNGGCGNLGCSGTQDYVTLDHTTTSGTLENFDTGVRYDVTWNTHASCKDIIVTIQDQ